MVVAAGVILWLRVPQISLEQPALFGALLLLSAGSSALKIELPVASSLSTMSVSFAIDLAALPLVGADATMLIAATSALSQCLASRQRNPPHRTIFSVAALVLTVACAGLAFNLLAPPHPGTMAALARPLVGAAIVYFVVNTGLIAVAMSLASGEPLAAVWHANFLWSVASYFVGAGAATVAAWATQAFGFWVAPVIVAPIYLTYRTYHVYLGRLEAQQRVRDTSDLHLATIEALAAAIDAKDQTTRVHVQRVQAYAAGLAQALKLPPDEVQAVRTAALLHDIGKLAVPAHILAKPGPLTPEEFAKVRIHPQIGAEIIASVPFPYPVAPLVLSHHEHWDGSGYPQGLAGDAIPLGARIISIVDYFDELASEQPHRGTLTQEAAVTQLRREAGRALDPELVELFIEQLPAMDARFRVGQMQRAGRPGMRSHPGAALAGAPQSALENIALAHQEIYTLYEIAQTIGTSLSVSDTMALISSKLAQIIPWSGCALFVPDQDGEVLHCRFATGLGAPYLLQKRVRVGEGLSGWVAQHRETLIGAAPEIDFNAIGLDAPATTRSAIVCPLESGARFIGALALFHTEAGLYTDDHRRLLARVAEQAAAVVSNATVFEEAQEASLTDPLTGLPNRRSLAARLQNEIARAQRTGESLALIALDVDGFKRVNDTYGHDAGDRVLRAVAATLVRGLRSSDLCVRCGGDEFIALLTGCGEADAEAKCRELQRGVDMAAVTVDNRRVAIGISAGAAIFPRDGRTSEELLGAADRRMYENKAQRRPLMRAVAEWNATQPGGTNLATLRPS
ncbi:MAG: HD domain-containing phosphohydrolase [Vicinamibacterales bacterium]